MTSPASVKATAAIDEKARLFHLSRVRERMLGVAQQVRVCVKVAERRKEGMFPSGLQAS
jgi:hypothetical protein